MIPPNDFVFKPASPLLRCPKTWIGIELGITLLSNVCLKTKIKHKQNTRIGLSCTENKLPLPRAGNAGGGGGDVEGLGTDGILHAGL